LVLPSGFPKQLDEWCLPTLSEERTQKDWGNWLFWFMAHRLHGLNRNSYEIIFMFLAKKTLTVQGATNPLQRLVYKAYGSQASLIK
jgi:hypothetical protein